MSFISDTFDALLGKSDKPLRPLQNFRPTGIDSGGFKFGLEGGNIVGGSTAERSGLVSRVSGLFNRQAGEVRGLRSLVTPGFSQFRQALRGVQESRLARLGDAETRAVGDVRDNLARRRVLGSSFGQDALSRTRAEFARERDDITAEIGLQEAETHFKEIEATRQLIGDEFNLARASVQTFIDNLNLEAGIATQLASGATSALASNAQLQAKILQQQVNNTQDFLTDILGTGAALATGGIIPSDRRLKTNIRRVGSFRGFNVYRFVYLWGEPAIGVMADEVEKIKPEAVTTVNGFKAVYYDRL